MGGLGDSIFLCCAVHLTMLLTSGELHKLAGNNLIYIIAFSGSLLYSRSMCPHFSEFFSFLRK